MFFSPALQALRLFLVWDSEGVSESEDTVLEEIFQSVDADSDSEEDEKKDKKAGKKAHKKEKKVVRICGFWQQFGHQCVFGHF